jgi:hypothetical protein
MESLIQSNYNSTDPIIQIVKSLQRNIVQEYGNTAGVLLLATFMILKQMYKYFRNKSNLEEIRFNERNAARVEAGLNPEEFSGKCTCRSRCLSKVKEDGAESSAFSIRMGGDMGIKNDPENYK